MSFPVVCASSGPGFFSISPSTVRSRNNPMRAGGCRRLLGGACLDPAAALELDEELDDEDVLQLELEESESEASEASKLLPTFSSSEFEASDPLGGS